jgi:hypothetical protein
MRKLKFVFFLLLLFGLPASSTSAHVPYIELWGDYSEQNPFVISDSIENSKSVYGWFETGEDFDVYEFQVTEEPVLVFANVLVPICPAYDDLLPWFAVVGPGLPAPEHTLPFTLPEGYGAVVTENLAPGEPRTTYFEPFGDKFYYREENLAFEQLVTTPGTWYIYYWDPYNMGGDYVAEIGKEEVFTFFDIIIALIYTPMIWFDLELHTPCPQEDLR